VPPHLHTRALRAGASYLWAIGVTENTLPDTEALAKLLRLTIVLPNQFLATDGATLNYADVDLLTYAALPTDGVGAINRTGSIITNAATNFAGASAMAPALAVTSVEYYNATLDHYFITDLQPDIDALDSGRIDGWARTGLSFKVFPSQASGSAGVNPVCRFYIPPEHGNSHFFSASVTECATILQKTASDPNYSGYAYETPSAFFIALPDTATGACPAGTIAVYRLWNQRADSNHRYTSDPAIKAQMIAKGYLAEGYGPDAVIMCAVNASLADATVLVSSSSPFAPGCDGLPATGVLYLNAEVEPMVAVNPRNPNNIIGVWQQDRWSNGGAQGLVTGASFDGGRTWVKRMPTFSRCSGGNAANGGDYARASDPWVTFAPDGTAYQIAISFTGEAQQSGSIGSVLVSRSADGGLTWSTPVTLITGAGAFFDDKESIAADPYDANFVYAVWDRLTPLNTGPSYFSRTIDAGLTWETARPIYDPGVNHQTINNQIVVLPDGSLINFFTQFDPAPRDGEFAMLEVVRSTDKGFSWSAPTVITVMQSVGSFDPQTGTPVRDGSNLGSIAVGPHGELVAVWQDARFTGGQRDAIAFARSLDGGFTWSSPARINAVPSVQAFLPTVHIRNDGTIGVTYYDFRNNTVDPTTLPTDYWLTRSADGVTWREAHVVASPFDLAIAPNAMGLFLGDYQSLASLGDMFVPFYVIANTSSAGNRTDVFSTLASSIATAFAKKAAAGAAAPESEEAVIHAEQADAAPMTPELRRKLHESVMRMIERRRLGATPRGAIPAPEPKEP